MDYAMSLEVAHSPQARMIFLNRQTKENTFFTPIPINVNDLDQFGLFTFNGEAWNCTHIDLFFAIIHTIDLIFPAYQIDRTLEQ
jgi:hypothetical protein